jgi:DNA-binding SARP family transcriptional activator
VEFGLLGPLEVRGDEEPLRLPARKQRALLALLLLHANRVVGRERLIDQLWGEDPPETAVKALQVYVSQLRKLLPAGMLMTRPPGYVLEVEPEAVDLLRFERLVAEARECEPARASVLLREALGLWRGPPLAEFGEEPFARVEATRLEDLRLAALEERIEADLSLGRHAELVSELEALVAEEPHRERLRGQLMLALYRSGRQAQALEAYRAARAALAELGLEPSAPLRQLEKQILTQDAALERPREPVVGQRAVLPGPLLPESPFPFVGREDELLALRALLEGADAGEGSLVLLAGEAGVGKTRLVRELAQDAAAWGGLVLYGTSDAAVRTPYQPLREWLEFILRACDPEVLVECLSGGEILGRLVPALARLTGPLPPPDPENDRYLLQSAAADVLRRLSRLQPLLLVADDAHWADSETLHLLRRLARMAPEARLLVVVGYRDRGEEIGPELGAALADLARLEGVTRLSLGKLSDEEIGTFVRIATEAEATAELVAAIGQLTGGTPLLLCELWRDLSGSGAIAVSDAGVQLARPLAELHGPERIRDVVRERLARLPAEATATLELAAVAGPQFEVRVLSEAAALDQVALLTALEEAVRIGMVEELPQPAPACRFTHELVRRAVYDQITGIRRAELHLRVGEALEHVHAANPARVLSELAHHFTLAAPVAGAERGVAHNVRAAEAAIASGAFSEGAALLSTALELGIADPRERARVQVELAYLLRETGRYRESDAVLAASLDAATGLQERGVATEALLQRSGRRLGDPQVDPDELRTVAEDAIETFEQLGDSRGLALARRRRALSLEVEGRWGEACAELERALVHADDSERQDACREVIGSLVRALCHGPAPVGEAIRRCEELREQHRTDRALEAVVTRCLSSLYAMAGRFDEARESVERSGVFLDELDHSTHSWIYRTHAAEAKELLGDRVGAEQDLIAKWRRKGDVAQDYTPDRRGMGAAYYLSLLYCDDGRWDDAERCLEYGREVPVPPRFRPESARGLAARARVAAHRGELAEAVALAQRGVELADQSDMLNLRGRVWLARAEVQRAAGAAAEADAAVAEAIRLYELKGNVAAAGRLRSALHGVAG